jgi:hypothetical protein
MRKVENCLARRAQLRQLAAEPIFFQVPVGAVRKHEHDLRRGIIDCLSAGCTFQMHSVKGLASSWLGLIGVAALSHVISVT